METVVSCNTLYQPYPTLSINVYQSGIRSLHVENGFPNPLSNCLRLERVLRGIKRSQGVTKRDRLPVTLEVRTVLYMANYDDVLFWEVCCTVFFGFLRSGEFTTTTNKFDTRIHMALDNVEIDRYENLLVIFIIYRPGERGIGGNIS